MSSAAEHGRNRTDRVDLTSNADVSSGGAAPRTVRSLVPARMDRLELRGQAISFFFAISQLAGGVAAPTIFGALIGTGSSRGPLTIGYIAGAAIMFAGGLIAWFFGVNAERKSLEDIATPLSVAPQGSTEPNAATT